MKPFKNINETFTREEFEEIEAIKDKTGLNWHDFIIHAAFEIDTHMIITQANKGE